MRFIMAAALSGAAILAGCATATVETPVDGSAAAAAMVKGALDAYKAPTPGTLVTYRSVFRGEEDSEIRQVVVDAGEDYAVFANLLEGGLEGPNNLFIEYSGLYWQECSLPPLTQYQREKLADMWPLEAGDSVSLPFQGDLSEQMTIEVEGWSETQVAGVGTVDTVVIKNSYKEQDLSTYSPQLGLSVRIDWGEPGTQTHLGFDELVSISQLEAAAYADYAALAQAACAR